jgi:hypothetical protein
MSAIASINLSALLKATIQLTRDNDEWTTEEILAAVYESLTLDDLKAASAKSTAPAKKARAPPKPRAPYDDECRCCARTFDKKAHLDGSKLKTMTDDPANLYGDRCKAKKLNGSDFCSIHTKKGHKNGTWNAEYDGELKDLIDNPEALAKSKPKKAPAKKPASPPAPAPADTTTDSEPEPESDAAPAPKPKAKAPAKSKAKAPAKSKKAPKLQSDSESESELDPDAPTVIVAAPKSKAKAPAKPKAPAKSKKAPKVVEPEPESDFDADDNSEDCELRTIDGIDYAIASDLKAYDPETEQHVGYYDPATKSIVQHKP